MPAAVAHAIIGASVVTGISAASPGRLSKKTVALGALLAVCPDFDVFLLWVCGLDGRWHRGFTHSLVFAVGTGLLVWVGTGATSIIDASKYVLAALSHSLTDLILSQGRDGIELFWPVSKQRVVLGLFPYIEFPWDPRSLSTQKLLRQVIEVCLIELLLFAPLFLFSYIIWKRSRRVSG